MNSSPTMHLGIQIRFVNHKDGTHVDDSSLRYEIKSMGYSAGKLQSITLKKGNGFCTLDVNHLPAFVIQFD
jgi:hypothetical protein